jgi:hypothetical protein
MSDSQECGLIHLTIERVMEMLYVVIAVTIIAHIYLSKCIKMYN